MKFASYYATAVKPPVPPKPPAPPKPQAPPRLKSATFASFNNTLNGLISNSSMISAPEFTTPYNNLLNAVNAQDPYVIKKSISEMLTYLQPFQPFSVGTLNGEPREVSVKRLVEQLSIQFEVIQYVI